jgi:retron-type reverse transcriptase
MSGKDARQTAVVVERTYDLLLWLLPKVEKFPRSFRFSVGGRSVEVGLDLLLALVEAAYSSEKAGLLEAASRHANGLRYLLRLAKDLRLLSLDSYGFAAERLDGWQNDWRLGKVGAGPEMKRAGNLWPGLVSFDNLLGAAKDAARGKRSRPDVAWFLLNLEPELLRLQRELRSGEYRPGPYRTFQVREPKPRLISAAPFADRVVHHALTRVLEPIFERRFAPNSFACRKGMGTHRALASAWQASCRFSYVLKCDVQKYFASIDHAILKELLARVVKCRPTLDLAADIIDGWNQQHETLSYFPDDTLFTPFERRRGLPLGNQTSQFFANVYLNGLDQLVLRELRPGHYVRYVDDFLLFDDEKRQLGEMRARVEDFLGGLRLRIHARKSRVYRAKDGVTFLGWRVFPTRLGLVRSNVVDWRRRLKAMSKAYRAGIMRLNEATIRVRAWIAHAEHGNTWKLRAQLFDEGAF